MREQKQHQDLAPQFTPGFLVRADNFQRQTKPQDDQTFEFATTITRVDLSVAAR